MHIKSSIYRYLTAFKKFFLYLLFILVLNYKLYYLTNYIFICLCVLSTLLYKK